LELLANKAKELSVPKNMLIERALRIYLEQLNRASYIKSYKRMAEDADIKQIAEEGMADYLSQLNEE
ncbi:MAG: CopG family transcriptional regulator, partial [Crocinitomicaceae bacterium]|nr:CopG family transcriptional regulator [Crocinitomicaceae bacterium]